MAGLTNFERAIVRNLRRVVGESLSVVSDEDIYAAWLRMFHSAEDYAEPANIVRYIRRSEHNEQERQDTLDGS